jgi:hypothetical protein
MEKLMRYIHPHFYPGFLFAMILALVLLFPFLLVGSCAKKPPVVEEEPKSSAGKDPFGKPDTCRIVTFQDEKKNLVMASVSVFNDEELVAMTLPFRYGDGSTPIRCDSIEFGKTRTEYFEMKFPRIDTTNQTILIGLLPDMFGNVPPLKKGKGEVARIYFTLKEGAKFQDFFLDTTWIRPSNVLKFVTLKAKGIYPIFDNKKAMIRGGIPMIPPKTEEKKIEGEGKEEERSSKKDSS